MAITILTYPGDGVTYEALNHYAAYADCPFVVKSDKDEKDNFMFKVELLNADDESLITMYRKPTSYDSDGPVFSMQLTELLAPFLLLPQPETVGLSHYVEQTRGWLEHKVRVTEIFDDVNGVPEQGDDNETDVLFAHNIAHENEPGIGGGAFQNVFLTLDAEGKIKTGGVKQISAWVNVGAAELSALQVVVITGNKESIFYIENSAGEIIIDAPQHGRIVAPISPETIDLGKLANRVLFRFVAMVNPVTPPQVPGIGIEEPPVGTPIPGGTLIKVSDEVVVPPVDEWKAGDIINVEVDGGGTIYHGNFAIIDKVDIGEFIIKQAYDAAEAAAAISAGFTVRLISQYDDEAEALAGECEWRVDGRCDDRQQVFFANHLGGIDVVDFKTLQSESVQSSSEIMKLNNLKQRFGTKSYRTVTLTTDWIEAHDMDLIDGILNTTRHWLRNGDDLLPVVLLTDTVKLSERRDLVSAEMTFELQDKITNI